MARNFESQFFVILMFEQLRSKLLWLENKSEKTGIRNVSKNISFGGKVSMIHIFLDILEIQVE